MKDQFTEGELVTIFVVIGNRADALREHIENTIYFSEEARAMDKDYLLRLEAIVKKTEKMLSDLFNPF